MASAQGNDEREGSKRCISWGSELIPSGAMARTKVDELRQDHRGDRRQCPVCTPKAKGRVSMDRVWRWSLDNPGRGPLCRESEGPDQPKAPTGASVL